MQQPVSRRDAYEPSLTATINGRDVEVASASMDRALPDPLAGGQLRSASGSITAVEGDDVTSTVATPWDPGTAWPPVPQSDASVAMDTGAGPVSLLGGGLVVSAEGGTSGREVEVEVADRYESLNRTISWDPLADAMPSESDGVSARYVGLQSTAVTDRILRHCGWYATPPVLGYSMLSVPGVGTMWPERGVVEQCGAASDGGYPAWANTPWGVGVQDVSALYRPQTAYTLTQRGRVEIVAMVGPAYGGAMRVGLSDGAEDYIRLSWTDAWVYVWVLDGVGTLTVAAQIPRTVGLAYATVNRVSSTSVQVILRHGGQSVSQTVTVPSSVTSTEFRRIWIIGDGIGSGFQVAYPSTAGTLEGWTPNAIIHPRPTGRNSMRVLPPVEGEGCADLLAEQCEAEVGTYWIDELGVLHWWDLARLDGQSPVVEINSDDDIAEEGFEWSHDRSQVKSRASVKWREPLYTGGWRAQVDLWHARGQTLNSGDDIEDWINVSDDEVWIMPDLTLGLVGTADMSDFNYAIGSWYGAVIEDTDTWAQQSGTLSMVIERVTGAAFKYRITWNGSRQAIMRTASKDANSTLWYRRRDFDLPILRGRAKYTFSDQITYSTQNGPVTAPEHEIDAGWWIQRADQAQYTADYAGARLTVAQPVLSSVALIPVPGLQLGDIVEVRETHATRLTIRGIVVEDSRSIDSGMGMSHSVAIRPTYVTRNGVTWEQWGSVLAGETHEQWATDWQGKQWQDFGATPLLGEDVI